MLIMVGNEDRTLKNIENMLGTLHPNEKRVNFKRNCLNSPYEKDGSLPSRLSLIGHTTGSEESLTFEGCTAEQLVSRLMSVLKSAALVEPGIKHSIKNIDLVSCGLGHINAITGKSYAIEVANLLAVELEKEGFSPIQLKAFTNLYGSGEKNYVAELRIKVNTEDNTFIFVGFDTIKSVEQYDNAKAQYEKLLEKRGELVTTQKELGSILNAAHAVILKSHNEPKPDAVSRKEHENLLLQYNAVLKQYENTSVDIKALDKRISVLDEKVSVFLNKHQKVFLKTKNIRATFDKEPTFNITVAAEEINKILKKPVNVASNPNQRGTFFHSTGEQKPKPANVISNPANSPNRFQRG